MPPPPNQLAVAAFSPNHGQNRRIFSQSSAPTSAYARHLQATSSYLRYYGGKIHPPEKARSERDILEEHHQFIQEYCGDTEGDDEEKRLVKSYYQKLYREFAVVELARWEEKQIAMRWRTKEEVLAGKGQFLCANLSCQNRESTLDENPDDPTEGGGGKEGLRGFELLFGYVEKSEKKSALVKVRVCDQCATKLRHIQGGDERKDRKRREEVEDRSRRSRHRPRSRSRDRGGGRRRRDDREGTKSGGRARSRSQRRDKNRRCSKSPNIEDERQKSQHRSRDYI